MREAWKPLRSGLGAPPPGPKRFEVENLDGAVLDGPLRSRSVTVDHHRSPHDHRRAFISDSEDRVLSANPFVLSEMDLHRIFVRFHRFDIDFDGAAVR